MTEVIRWISIVLMWVATGFNVYVAILNARIRRKLMEQLEIWKTRNEQKESEE